MAATVSARSLKERIPEAALPVELQPLVSSFNGMLERLDESFVRLANFSADIAHELRTPLTQLITRSIVEAHGGRIHYESVQGITRFELSFPGQPRG